MSRSYLTPTRRKMLYPQMSNPKIKQFEKQPPAVGARIARPLALYAEFVFCLFIATQKEPPSRRFFQLVDISKLGLNSKIKKFSYSFICGKGYSPPFGGRIAFCLQSERTAITAVLSVYPVVWRPAYALSLISLQSFSMNSSSFMVTVWSVSRSRTETVLVSTSFAPIISIYGTRST